MWKNIKEERKDLLLRFDASHYRRTARVVLGEPPNEYKEKAYAEALKSKQVRLTAEWNTKKRTSSTKRNEPKIIARTP